MDQPAGANTNPEHSSKSKHMSLQELSEIQNKVKIAFENGKISEEEYNLYKKKIEQEIEQARQTLAVNKQSMSFCPECGGKLPNPDVKFCPECGTPLSHSTASPQEVVQQQINEPRGNPKKIRLITLLCSLFVIGLGQVYNGDIKKALLFLGGGLFGKIIWDGSSIPPIAYPIPFYKVIFLYFGIGIFFVVLLWSIIDAYRTTTQMNDKIIPCKSTKLSIMLGYAILVFALLTIESLILAP